MPSALSNVALLLVLTSPPLNSGVQVPTPPTFPSAVEVVRLDVVVLDQRGQPVTGLTVPDFEVEEEGKRRPIVSFDAIVVRPAGRSASLLPVAPERSAAPRALGPDEGRCVLIFFDDVHISAPTDEWVRRHLRPFLAREVRDGDWITLVAPHSGVWWTARTAWEHQQIPAVISRLRGQLNRDPFRKGMSDVEAMDAVERAPRTLGGPRGREDMTMIGGRNLLAEEVYQVARRRITRTLRELTQAVLSLTGLKGRKSLILYSEGFVLAPSLAEFDQVIELARRANVAIYLVAPGGLMEGCPPTTEGAAFSPCSESQRRMARAGAIHLAEETGGRESSLNDPTAELQRVMEESSAYYLVGYSPVSKRPGGRRVRVSVRRDDLRVLARRRYVVMRSESVTTGASPEMAALRSVADATDLPFTFQVSFPERTDPPSVGPPGRGPAQRARGRPVHATIEIDVSDAGTRQLGIIAEARPRDGGVSLIDSFQVAIPEARKTTRIERRWDLPPGVWQCRVVASELSSDRRGSVLLTFEVEPLR